jgi:DNA replication and repair protein RecF
MHLQKLTLYNYKNYDSLQASFGPGVVCLLGLNGSGKTNLLDAIYYLAFTKSSLSGTDSQNIRLGEEQFMIKGWFASNGQVNEVTCAFQSGSKKVVRENNAEYNRLSQHIGKYPVVLVAPGDTALIDEGGEGRRRFFDSLISELDALYLDHLITYQTFLKQRNAALRIFSEQGRLDYDLLATYLQKLQPAASYIYQTRKRFMSEFLPRLQQQYLFLSDAEGEQVGIDYRSDLHAGDWGKQLEKALSRDLALQRTTLGIHRDDYLFTLQNTEIKRFGSQGQQKSFVIGLKCAEFESLHEHKNLKPLLLLDDIFDKLDDVRIGRLLALVRGGTFGQVFITDARPDRTITLLQQAGVAAQIFRVESGNLKAHVAAE